MNSTFPLYPLFTPPARPFASASDFASPFTPYDIDASYGLASSPSDGNGVCVAAIEAFSSETLLSDFKMFGKTFGLPENELNIYYPDGSGTENSVFWRLEAAADTQWIYAAAPSADIMCVFAANPSIEALFSAVKYAIRKGADIISMSWGSREFFGQSEYGEIMKNSGKIFIASAGDTGAEVLFPSSSDASASIGGTVLHRSKNGEVLRRSAWINGGGGASRFTKIPEWQKKFGRINELSGNFRATPDIALDAAVNPGYAVYSEPDGGMVSVGGTSVAAPVFSGICARILAKNPNFLSHGERIPEYLYKLAGETGYDFPQYFFDDITVGTNGRYYALPGYDLCTGLGAPKGENIIVFAANSEQT